jgi:antirestriction protein
MPRIYVACLASYNAGVLHGAWIDIDENTDVKEAIDAMLASSPSQGAGAEEWRIDDHDGWMGLDPAAYCENELPELARMLDEHGEAFAAWVGNCASGWDFDDYESAFQDVYAGEWGSLEDFAANLLEESGELAEIPERLRRYFDYQAYGRDLELGGDVWSQRSNGILYVFWNR